MAGFVAANPEDFQTLPRLHVRRKLPGDYNFLPLAQRVDLYRSFGLMGCSPEWSQVSPKGDRGTGYKVTPWAHMTPYPIQASFRWAVANPNLEPRPVDSEVLVIVGVTDNWERHEKVSSSGAKVYVQVSLDCACRDAALARVAGLLAEEDLDRCPWLSVDLGPQEGAGIVEAPFLTQWGMAETPASMHEQQRQGFECLCMETGFE